jgi:hypothetical protein
MKCGDQRCVAAGCPAPANVPLHKGPPVAYQFCMITGSSSGTAACCSADFQGSKSNCVYLPSAAVLIEWRIWSVMHQTVLLDIIIIIILRVMP